MKTVLLRRARVVDPINGVDAVRDLLIEGGRVSKVAGRLQRREGTTIDLDGLVLAPGFIDINTHLREPGYEWKETIASGSAAAAAAGYTAVSAMPTTDPANDNRAVTETIRAAAARHAPIHVHVIGAISRRRSGEGLAEIGEMVAAGAVAISDGGRSLADGSLMRRALEYARIFDIPVLARAEDRSLAVDGVMHEGMMSTRLGLAGIPASAEDSTLARDLLIAEDTGGRLHVQTLSTARALGLVTWARRRGVRVTCEVTPHHTVLDHGALEEFDTSLKVRPPLRPEGDRKALVKGLADGQVDALATDHQPHHPDEKAVEFAQAPWGASNLDTAVGVALTRLVGEEGLALERLVAALSSGPARVLGVPGGSLAPGEPADITVLDLERRWSVGPDELRSLGKNTPFPGWELQGRAVMTIVGGRIVHDAR